MRFRQSPVVTTNPPLDAARRYLNAVRDQTGLDYTNIARLAKLDPSTLTRPFSRPGFKGRISVKTLRRIAEATNIPLPKEIDPFPTTTPDDLDFAVKLSEMIQVG